MKDDKKKYHNLFEMVLHKIVILIGIGAALLIIVSAIAPHVLAEDVNIDGYPICEEKMNVIDVPCVMITVPINCSTKTFSVYDAQNTTIIDNAAMTDYRTEQYYFNLTLSTGKYLISACNGLITREVKLEATKMLWIIYLAFAIAAIFLILGLVFKEAAWGMLSGFLVLITGIYISANGIDGIIGDWYITSFGWIVIGIGAIITLTTILLYVNES